MIIAIIFIFLTLLVLIFGILLMAKGGELNKKYGNKLMVARVSLQFAAIIILAFMYLFMAK